MSYQSWKVIHDDRPTTYNLAYHGAPSSIGLYILASQQQSCTWWIRPMQWSGIGHILYVNNMPKLHSF